MSRWDWLFVAGVVLIAAGLLGWDWRVAAIAVGIATCTAAWKLERKKVGG